jgi:GTPase SAR1 family protein
MQQPFNPKHETTLGVEFGSKMVLVNDTKVKLQVWDTVINACSL